MEFSFYYPLLALQSNAPQIPAPAPSQSSIYSSMAALPTTSSSLYASQPSAPAVNSSIYASMPSVPTFGKSSPAKKEESAKKDEYPSLPEGFSTVGLMLWPGKGGELLVTGFMEGQSADGCGLETGDVIIKVNEISVEGMPASDAAAHMAGPTGSSVTITTSRITNGVKTTHTAVVIRDVSSDEANKKTKESFQAVSHVLIFLSCFPSIAKYA
jgi:hypothetical protein